MDDLEAVIDDPDGHQLLSVVSSVHHQRVDQALNNRALSLAEPLGGVTARAVRQKLGELLFDGDVILKENQKSFKKVSKLKKGSRLERTYFQLCRHVHRHCNSDLGGNVSYHHLSVHSTVTSSRLIIQSTQFKF